MLGKNAIKADIYGDKQRSIFFRRELIELEPLIDRAHQIYKPLGWDWHEQKKRYTSPKGAVALFKYLDRDRDVEKYMGGSNTDLYFEELPNWPNPEPIYKMRGTLRSPHGVPCQFHGTGNPGGPGHHWVKARYIDPAPGGMVPIEEVLPNGDIHHRIFIPSKLSDNAILMENDPTYVNNLYMSGSESLVRAWLDGDWDQIEGAFFDCWNDDLVIMPFDIPDHWPKFRSFDWGSAKPFSVGWWTVVGEDYLHYGKTIPRGALIRYREYYGAKKHEDGTTQPNKGLKWTVERVDKEIREKEKDGERFKFSVADPSIFSEDGGPSIAERSKIPWIAADNKRIPGWDMLRARIIGEFGKPMIYFFKECVDSIRTIPFLQHDELNIEDLDTNGEDHAADDVRYMCMARPYTPRIATIKRPKDMWDEAFDKETQGDMSWLTR